MGRKLLLLLESVVLRLTASAIVLCSCGVGVRVFASTGHVWNSLSLWPILSATPDTLFSHPSSSVLYTLCSTLDIVYRYSPILFCRPPHLYCTLLPFFTLPCPTLPYYPTSSVLCSLRVSACFPCNLRD
jgi:hypothetical protein